MDVVVDHGHTEALRHGVSRSSRWPKVEKAFLATSPHCAACAVKDPEHPVQVHHVFPFHYVVALGRPDLELDPRNLITLCETRHGMPTPNHHLLIGHLDDFKSSNLDVSKDCKTYVGESLREIENNGAWIAERINSKLKPLDKMTDEEKAALRRLMDETFPLPA